MIAEKLRAFSPPRGDAASWKTLTDDLSQTANSLANAAGRQNREACQAEHKRLSKSCTACHDAHR
jgi:cytochrome c556